jgi:hypothetical protein
MLRRCIGFDSPAQCQTIPSSIGLCVIMSMLSACARCFTLVHIFALLCLLAHMLSLTMHQGNAAGNASDIATIGTLLYAARVNPHAFAPTKTT